MLKKVQQLASNRENEAGRGVHLINNVEVTLYDLDNDQYNDERMSFKFYVTEVDKETKNTKNSIVRWEFKIPKPDPKKSDEENQRASDNKLTDFCKNIGYLIGFIENPDEIETDAANKFIDYFNNIMLKHEVNGVCDRKKAQEEINNDLSSIKVEDLYIVTGYYKVGSTMLRVFPFANNRRFIFSKKYIQEVKDHVRPSFDFGVSNAEEYKIFLAERMASRDNKKDNNTGNYNNASAPSNQVDPNDDLPF